MKSHNMVDGSIIEHNMSQHQLEDFEHRSSTLEQLELHVYSRGIWSSVAEVVQFHYYFFQKLPPSCSTSALQGKQSDIQSQVIPNFDIQSHLNLRFGPRSHLKSQRCDQFLHANKLNVCCSDDLLHVLYLQLPQLEAILFAEHLMDQLSHPTCILLLREQALA